MILDLMDENYEHKNWISFKLTLDFGMSYTNPEGDVTNDDFGYLSSDLSEMAYVMMRL